MKTIALLDHHSGGHHVAFIKLFGKYLIKLGYRVCVFFPEKNQKTIDDYFSSKFPYNSFFIFPFPVKTKSFTSFGIFNAAVSSLYLWYQYRKHIKKAEQQFKINFQAVFFAWLDDHMANYLPHQIVDYVFPYAWSGLYFHPWYLFIVGKKDNVSFSSIDSVLKSKRCLSVGVHDEFLMSKLQNRIKKPVIFFPEIADDSPPDLQYDLAQRVREKSNKRIVIGLIGLSRRKGTVNMITLAEQADPSLYYFFFAGKFPEADYPTHERERAGNFFKNLPENCLYFPENIEEGARINAVIQSLDILYIVYQNFKSSSNFITKAAHFKKVVLATNRFWIGRKASQYNMGKVVSESNIGEMLEAIAVLREHIINGTWDFSKYDSYLSAHRQEMLEQALFESLKKLN